jgi:hypothetical protein
LKLFLDIVLPCIAYLLFAAERRPTIKAERPDLGFGDLARAIGEEWKKMSDAEKAPFNQRAAEEKAKYQQAMEMYLASKK